MRIPRGELRRSRIVDDAAAVFRTVLDEELIDYVVFELQDALPLGETTRGVVMSEDEVSVFVYDTERRASGRDGLERLAVTDPTCAAVHAVDVAELANTHEIEALRAPPGEPARVLAGGERLAAKTLDVAPVVRREESRNQSAVEAFLADVDAIEGVRPEARKEARARALEWGLDNVLADDADESAVIDAGSDSR